MKAFLILISFLVSFSVQSFPKIPEIWNNPGHLCSVKDKDFDRHRYPERIPYCRRNVSTSSKDKICKDYGVNSRKNYTVDHIIPLSIGGSNSFENLWCQHKNINSSRIEFEIFLKVRDGEMSQAEAVHFIMKYKFNPRIQPRDNNLKPD